MYKGTSLIFRLEAGQIGITVTPDPELFNNTNGLLGTYDDDSTNDLTLQNEDILASDVGAELIYSIFGESCAI